MSSKEADDSLGCLRFIIVVVGGIGVIVALLMAIGCSPASAYVQVGDTLETAIEKQGPCVGVQRENAKEGEVWAVLCGGFVVAVFDRKEWDFRGGSTVELVAEESFWTGAPRVKRVDLDWRALPGVER